MMTLAQSELVNPVCVDYLRYLILIHLEKVKTTYRAAANAYFQKQFDEQTSCCVWQRYEIYYDLKQHIDKLRSEMTNNRLLS